jgi:site-specific recombinase XerD
MNFIKIIQELLGHQDIKTTLIYTSISKDDLYDAVKILEEYFNSKK